MDTIKLGAINTHAVRLAHQVLGLYPEQFGKWGIAFDIRREEERGSCEGKTYVKCSIDVTMSGKRIARLHLEFHFRIDVPEPYEVKISFIEVDNGEDGYKFVAFLDGRNTWRLDPVH